MTTRTPSRARPSRRLSALLVSATCCLVASVSAAAQTVERLDKRLDAILSVNATLERWYSDPSGFLEGPTWVKGRPGYLIFADIPGNTLYRVDGKDRVRPLLTDIQLSHEGAFFDAPRGRYMVGPNGTTFAPDGRLVYCVFGGGRIESLDLHNGKRDVMVSEADGKPLAHPNDLAFGPGGDLYFTTDPAVYRLHQGKAERVTDGIKPNGIAFSPDQRLMYTTDDPDRLVVYDVEADGTLSHQRAFATLTGDVAVSHVDGVKVDHHGNVFAVGPEGIWILTPDAHHVGTIHAPVKRFSNLEFGGAHADQLFLTGPEGVYRLRLKAPAVLR
jgi:gluconolactonase